MVDVSVNDPESKYTSIILYYGYSWEHDDELVYSSFAVTESRMNIPLNDIFTSDAFHIYLEGTTSEGTELLDEIWVTPPYELYTSVYMYYIDSKEVGFSVYSDMDVGNINYEMNIYKNDLLIRTEQIVLEEGEFHGSEFVIDDLKPNTTYYLECIAIHTNPQTLRLEKATVYQEEITTLGAYTYSYIKEIVDEYLEVTIVLNDPNHNFQEVSYDSYDTSGEFEIYLAGQTYGFTPDGDEKYVTFSIFLPIDSSYEITIVFRNQSDFLVKHIIDIIINE